MEGIVISTQSGSLKSYLRTTYGANTQRRVNDFGKELQRVARYKNHHHFYVRCNKSDLVPQSLRIKSPVNTDRAQLAAEKATKVFLQERIKVTWRVRNAATKNAEILRANLEKELSEADFKKVEQRCTRTAEKCFE